MTKKKRPFFEKVGPFDKVTLDLRIENNKKTFTHLIGVCKIQRAYGTINGFPNKPCIIAYFKSIRPYVISFFNSQFARDVAYDCMLGASGDDRILELDYYSYFKYPQEDWEALLGDTPFRAVLFRTFGSNFRHLNNINSNNMSQIDLRFNLGDYQFKETTLRCLYNYGYLPIGVDEDLFWVKLAKVARLLPNQRYSGVHIAKYLKCMYHGCNRVFDPGTSIKLREP